MVPSVPGARVGSLFLLRHGMRRDFGDPAWAKTAPRPSDPPLSDAGRVQALDAARALAGRGLTGLYCSPFLRCIETSHPCADATGLPLFVETGLGEWLNPEWFKTAPVLAPFEELHARFPRLDPGYRARVPSRWPEDEQTAFEREALVLKELLASAQGPLALIGHGHTVQGCVQALTGAHHTELPPCASITELRFEHGRWQVVSLFGTAHLSVGESSTRLA